MNRYLSELEYSDAPVRGYYDLTAPLGFWSERAGLEVWAGIGFRTNFVTGRKLLVVRRIVQPKMDAAAVVHDSLYCTGLVPRHMADAIFRDAMLVSGVASWRAWAAWVAVRAFGGQFYAGKTAEENVPEIYQ